MTSLVSERSWLMDPRLLKLVHQCRRLIRAEFGIKLHLTEEHLEQQLADFAGKTRSNDLAQTWETLKPHIPALATEGSGLKKADDSKRMYRGQAIADTPAGKTGRSEEESQPRRTKVIYRGQLIG